MANSSRKFSLKNRISSPQIRTLATQRFLSQWRSRLTKGQIQQAISPVWLTPSRCVALASPQLSMSANFSATTATTPFLQPPGMQWETVVSTKGRPTWAGLSIGNRGCETLSLKYFRRITMAKQVWKFQAWPRRISTTRKITTWGSLSRTSTGSTPTKKISWKSTTNQCLRSKECGSTDEHQGVARPDFQQALVHWYNYHIWLSKVIQ